MLKIPLLAQMNAFDAGPGDVLLYLAFTFGFLAIVWFLNKWTRPLGVNLILWGILTIMLSMGYGLIGLPSVMVAIPALTRIGFLLVLGGVAWSLLSAYPNPLVSKEADHV